MGKKLHFPQPSEQRIDPFPHANSKIILTMILLVNFMRGLISSFLILSESTISIGADDFFKIISILKIIHFISS